MAESDPTASLLSSLVNLATPFAQQFAYGKDQAGELALQQERNKYNALNGSGPNQPISARATPNGSLDMLFGSATDRATRATGLTGIGLFLIVAVLGAGGYFLLKKL